MFFRACLAMFKVLQWNARLWKTPTLNNSSVIPGKFNIYKSCIKSSIKITSQRRHGITLKTCIISTNKENGVYDCCVCQTDLHSEDCVACDVCLNWYHLKMYWTTFCAEKNLLVLPKLLKIALNIINLNIYVYFFFFKLYSITVTNV